MCLRKIPFWQDEIAEYSGLTEVARRLFNISVSSAQEERDSSSVGCTIADIRSCPSPLKVEAIEMVGWGW